MTERIWIILGSDPQAKPDAGKGLSEVRGAWAPAELHDQVREYAKRLSRLIAVSEILDWKYEDLGTVEGTLEVVSAHNGYEIRLYEPVWLQPVRCTFDEDLLEDVLRNFKRRVEVSGLIRYTKDGMPVSAKVLKIEPMPDPSQLPSWREVKGILRN